MANGQQIDQLVTTVIGAFVGLSETDNVDPDDVELQVRDCAKSFVFRTVSFSEDDIQAVMKIVMANVQVTMDFGQLVVDESEYVGHTTTWYTDKKDAINKRYRKYVTCLQKKSWPPLAVTRIDQNSDDIMNMLGDPTEASFSVRGLVMGDVQSGKTANFIALCNKAADAGYRVIIVAAGIIEKLRRQTQGRLEKEFSILDKQNRIPTLTGAKFDFDARVGDVAGRTPLNVFDKNLPVLCVVKKNVSVLRNLYDWLNDGCPVDSFGKRKKLDYPLLFIDDEADNASVDTSKHGKDDDETNPTKTNEFIRRILNVFAKASYVGVTATPFANVFINPNTDSEMLGEDLFPKNFVYRLPVPPKYFGVDVLFSGSGSAENSVWLREIEDLEVYLPAKHKKDHVLNRQLPESMRFAIGYYMLVNAILDARKNEKKVIDRSMLIHVSRFVDVQNALTEYVDAYVKRLRNAIKCYHGDCKKASKNPEIAFLKYIWDKENLEDVYENISWTNILKQYLSASVESIEVKSVNSKGDTIAYDEPPIGKRYIVIGGNALARGLTLEGLVVSYFRRNTLMCDTLLQMARWFGYRDDYRLLCRVWLNPQAIDNYHNAGNISTEVSDMFESIYNARCSPKDFAIRIRKSPGAFLPTARNKMRAAKDVKIPMSLSGRAVETPRMINSMEINSSNDEKVHSFIRANLSHIRKSEDYPDVIFLRDISADNIANMFSGVKTGPLNYGFFADVVVKYIRESGKPWDVAIVSRGRLNCPEDHEIVVGENNEDSIVVVKAARPLDVDGDNLIQICGTKLKVTSGGVMHYGLSRNIVEEIKNGYRDKYLADKAKRHQKIAKNLDNLTPPDSVYLEKMGELGLNPLLVIQRVQCSVDKTLKPAEQTADGLAKGSRLKVKEFFGFSFGFAGARDDQFSVTYHMTAEAIKQMMMSDDMEDE